jgi:hypothetical protein
MHAARVGKEPAFHQQRIRDHMVTQSETHFRHPQSVSNGSHIKRHAMPRGAPAAVCRPGSPRTECGGAQCSGSRKRPRNAMPCGEALPLRGSRVLVTHRVATSGIRFTRVAPSFPSRPRLMSAAEVEESRPSLEGRDPRLPGLPPDGHLLRQRLASGVESVEVNA